MISPTHTVQTNNSNTPVLQPMRFSEILDTIFSLYRKHFLLFLGILTVYFLGSLVTYSLEGFLQGSNLKGLVPNLVSMPFVLVSMGGVIIATAALFLDRHITSTDALKQTLRRFWDLLGGYLLWAAVLIIPFIGSLLFLASFGVRRISSISVLFIPFALVPFSIYFAVRWGFVFEVLLLEKTNVRNAFKRSGELVRGRWWWVFGMFVLILLLSAAIHELIASTVYEWLKVIRKLIIAYAK